MAQVGGEAPPPALQHEPTLGHGHPGAEPVAHAGGQHHRLLGGEHHCEHGPRPQRHRAVQGRAGHPGPHLVVGGNLGPVRVGYPIQGYREGSVERFHHGGRGPRTCRSAGGAEQAPVVDRLGGQGGHRALARRRHRDQLMAVQARSQRLNPFAAVVGEVVDVHAPARGRDGCRDGPGQRTFIQRGGAVNGDLRQDRGESGVAPPLTRCRGGAGTEVESLARSVEPASGPLPEPAPGCADRGTLGRGLDGRLEQARPLQAAELAVQVLPRGHRPRHGHRVASDRRHEAVAIVGHRPRVGAPPRPPAAVERGHRSTGCDHRHDIAAHSGAGGLHHAHGRVGRDGCVHRRAARPQHGDRSLGGQRMPRSDRNWIRALTGCRRWGTGRLPCHWRGLYAVSVPVSVAGCRRSERRVDRRLGSHLLAGIVYSQSL